MSNTPKRKSPQTSKKKSQTATRTPAKPQDTGLGRQIEWGKVVGIGLGGLVVGALFWGLLSGGDPFENVASGLPDNVRVTQVESGVHIEGPIDYDEVLPPGGPHNPIWQNCGFYDGVIRTENAVHSLEHGAVWLTFKREVGEDGIARLRELMDARDKVLVSEQPLQDSLIVATAWGFQYETDDPDDEGLLRFINELAGSLDAPEPGGVCQGGVSSLA